MMQEREIPFLIGAPDCFVASYCLWTDTGEWSIGSAGNGLDSMLKLEQSEA